MSKNWLQAEIIHIIRQEMQEYFVLSEDSKYKKDRDANKAKLIALDDLIKEFKKY